jgi:hypothetical protein
VARKARMSSEEELPDGPRPKFVAELRRYYRAAGHPPLREVSQAVERHQDPRLVKVTASAETVRRMITGKVLPVDRDRVYAVFHVLCEMSEIDPGAPRWSDYDNDETNWEHLRTLWTPRWRTTTMPLASPPGRTRGQVKAATPMSRLSSGDGDPGMADDPVAAEQGVLIAPARRGRAGSPREQVAVPST